MGGCLSLRYKYCQEDLKGNTFSHYSLTSATSCLDLYPTIKFVGEENDDEEEQQDHNGTEPAPASWRRSSVPLIEEWGEIVIQDDYLPPIIEGQHFTLKRCSPRPGSGPGANGPEEAGGAEENLCFEEIDLESSIHNNASAASLESKPDVIEVLCDNCIREKTATLQRQKSGSAEQRDSSSPVAQVQTSSVTAYLRMVQRRLNLLQYFRVFISRSGRRKVQLKATSHQRGNENVEFIPL